MPLTHAPDSVELEGTWGPKGKAMMFTNKHQNKHTTWRRANVLGPGRAGCLDKAIPLVALEPTVKSSPIQFWTSTLSWVVSTRSWINPGVAASHSARSRNFSQQKQFSEDKFEN